MKKRLKIMSIIIFFALCNILFHNYKINSNVYAQELVTEYVNYALGDYHTIALKSDGTVWAWGYNGYGQLGDGTTTCRSIPTQIKGLTNIKTIVAGGNHNIAIKDDGTVWTWGYNCYGQLGDGTTTHRNIPTQIKGLTNIKTVVAGGDYSIAIKDDGTVWVWGCNCYGQLGDGTITSRNIPTKIEELTNIKTIVAGSFHNIAIKNDGTVWAWGWNSYKQLGDGTTTDRLTPVQIKGLTGIKTIVVGNNHNIAIKDDETVWVWGWNGYGQLGDGTIISRNTSTQIKGLTNIKTIVTGGSHSIAIKDDGTVWACGCNRYGQLGDGTTTDKLTPVQIKGLTDIKTIVAGNNHNIALKNDGTVWAWGQNKNGELGDGTRTNRHIPTQITALTPTNYPQQPQNISAIPENGNISLSWDTATNAISYTIKRATISGGEYKTIAENITKTSYIDNNVTSDTTYYYVVSAVNNGFSNDSEEVSATAKNIIPVPTIPTIISATSGNQIVELSWNDVEGAENYIIKRSTTSGSGYTVIAENITETTYTDAEVTNGTTYYYVVVANSVAGESGNSEEVTATPKEPTTVPIVPANITPTAGNQTVEFNWDSVPDADSYVVKRSTTSGSEYTMIAENITETTYVDTELTNGTTYYYIITAKNKVGESDNSQEISATPNLLPPITPTNIQAIGKDQTVNLSWDSVLGADSYIVKRSTTQDGTYSTIASDITSTTYEDTGLTNGTTYYYMVSAKNEAGESVYSSKISAIPLNEPPASPTGLTVKNSDKSVNLTWSNAEGAFNYKIKRATTSGGPYTLVANNITSTTYTDAGLTNGTSYYYVVSAVNTKGESENSTEVTALPDITKPNSPTGINVSTADKRVTLTWNKIVNADSYIVKKATTSGGPYTIVANNLTKTTYTELGLNNGTSYYYIIIAKNEKGESEPSSEIEAVPGIQKPSNLIIQVVDKEIKLSWDPVSNADVYKIKRSENLDGPYTVLSEGITGTNYVDNSIQENKLYYYVISAVNSLGESPETEPISTLVKDSVDKRYILLVVLNNGMQKEYDVDTSTAVKFINWYLNRANGIGSPFFTLFNQEKDDVFENSKDYIGFNTILYYQLNEYKVYMQK
ncbi:fibronectin type III domain-containing protein [Vallitalea guaymasensis]|uniref:RCC1 domain-containing protein n=1 Tax=Vallitalea guaymasensis TaxID=1185412 RepID=UPI00235221DA|nr:fibronectin type III domain-containing protein [Vallitalea guaymasensis]